ncbi:hypothetical protein D9758_016800 [Tetrapyrgos nigripes]|uniref:Aminotransferase class I/classII large domain-containing protein n=1 Tax=Tetrapyrgos nigripes TaxID=182062 RepID=A0A8H5CH23_9AGAR|nr:hypothetical protein D9758_016800 [Tetrapyrgos nigripes]
MSSQTSLKILPASYYDHFLSINTKNAKEREPSPVRGDCPLGETLGGTISAAGKFHPETLPINYLNLTAQNPKFTAKDPLPNDISLKINIDALVTGLHNREIGDISDLARWLGKLQHIMHGRSAGEGWRISMGSGSRELIYRTIQAMVKHRDPIFVESFVYADIIPMFETICNPIGVETDAEGICAESLRKTLESWPPGKPKPRFLYTVPYGCNPTGITATTERRKEVLKLAREHDFIILEDDPYYYLYYGPADRPPSYFALEATERTENGQCEVGRVVRFDSLTMVLSAGMSIGWASGPEELLARIERHPVILSRISLLLKLYAGYSLAIFGRIRRSAILHCHSTLTYSAMITADRLDQGFMVEGSGPDSNSDPSLLLIVHPSLFLTTSSRLQSSSLSHVIINALLTEWGYDGFNGKTRSVSSFYRQKRDIFEAAMKSHLEGLTEWQLPEAGVFFWFKLLVPDSANVDVEALRDVVRMLPGAVFWQNGNSGYVRVSFSQPTEDDVHKELNRLGRFLREEIWSA